MKDLRLYVCPRCKHNRYFDSEGTHTTQLCGCELNSQMVDSDILGLADGFERMKRNIPNNQFGQNALGMIAGALRMGEVGAALRGANISLSLIGDDEEILHTLCGPLVTLAEQFGQANRLVAA